MRAVLDPFAVHSQGRTCRATSCALSCDQVENVVEALGLREDVARNAVTVTGDTALADEVVAVVRRRRAEGVRRPSSSSSRDANPSR